MPRTHEEIHADLKQAFINVFDTIEIDAGENLKSKLADKFIEALLEWAQAAPEERKSILDRRGPEIVAWFKQNSK